MTFKKIHRRADLPQFQDLQARAPATTTTTTVNGAGSGPNVVEPTGPPTVNGAHSSTTSAAAAISTPSSASSSSVVTTTSTTSAAATTTAVPTTPPAASTTPVAHVSSTPVVVTRTSRLTVSASSSTASATSTSNDSSSMGLGSIAGIAAAAIIAIGVGTAFIIWLIRRRKKNHDIDEEPFNRNSFLRNSTAIPDDDAPLPSRIRPTPPGPAMSERTPTPLYGQQQAFGADPGFNYATQPSYGAVPGQTFSPSPFGPGGAPATPLPHSPGFGTAYDQQGFNHGGYQELTRGPGMHDYPPSPASRGFSPQLENPHSPGYTGHESFPMPPPNVAGGAQFDEHGHEIQHRSMTPAQQGQVVSVRNSLHNGTPVQLGFAPAPHAGAPGAPAPAHGRAPGQRPETVYDDEDAYGGI